jgi:hypothetical protein
LAAALSAAAAGAASASAAAMLNSTSANLPEASVAIMVKLPFLGWLSIKSLTRYRPVCQKLEPEVNGPAEGGRPINLLKFL